VKTAWEFDPNKMCLRLGNIHRIYQIPSIPEEKIQLLMHGGRNPLRKKNLRSPSMEMELTFSDLEQGDNEDDDDDDDDDSDDEKEEEKEEEQQQAEDEEEEGEDAEMLKDLEMVTASTNAFRIQNPLDLSCSSAAAVAVRATQSPEQSFFRSSEKRSEFHAVVVPTGSRTITITSYFQEIFFRIPYYSHQSN
jgi:hypothetical protein